MQNNILISLDKNEHCQFIKDIKLKQITDVCAEQMKQIISITEGGQFMEGILSIQDRLHGRGKSRCQSVEVLHWFKRGCCSSESTVSDKRCEKTHKIELLIAENI